MAEILFQWPGVTVLIAAVVLIPVGVYGAYARNQHSRDIVFLCVGVLLVGTGFLLNLYAPDEPFLMAVMGICFGISLVLNGIVLVSVLRAWPGLLGALREKRRK